MTTLTYTPSFATLTISEDDQELPTGLLSPVRKKTVLHWGGKVGEANEGVASCLSAYVRVETRS